MPPSSSETRTGIQFPFITPVALRKERAERLDAIDLPELYQRVAVWIEARPLMKWSDSRPAVVARLIAGEIREFIAEIQLKNPSAVNWEEAKKEKIDIAFFIIALLFGNKLAPDYDRIWRNIDGLGSRSDIYDQIYEIAINIVFSDITQATEQILILWSSAVVHLPVSMDVQKVLTDVLEKNTNNYPVDLMQCNMLPADLVNNPDQGSALLYRDLIARLVPLPLEQNSAAFEHRVRCLRLIRHAIKLSPHRKLRPAGMVPEDYEQYAFYILNHAKKDESFWQLSILLAAQHHVDWQLLVNVEKLEHRASPGLSQSVDVEIGPDGKLKLVHLPRTNV